LAKIVVKNSGSLKGRIRVSGAKNAVLPILAATLLAEEECVIEDIPLLKDVIVMSEVLRSLGSDVSEIKDSRVTFQADVLLVQDQLIFI